jgi:hypothetical protein
MLFQTVKLHLLVSRSRRLKSGFLSVSIRVHPWFQRIRFGSRLAAPATWGIAVNGSDEEVAAGCCKRNAATCGRRSVHGRSGVGRFA